MAHKMKRGALAGATGAREYVFEEGPGSRLGLRPRQATRLARRFQLMPTAAALVASLCFRGGCMTESPPTKRAPTRQERWRERQRGLLTREPCDVCGHENAEAHHPEYAPQPAVWFMDDKGETRPGKHGFALGAELLPELQARNEA
jgi:hypothetical protein